MKSNKRKAGRRRSVSTSAIQQQPKIQPAVEVKPEEALERWIYLRHEIESGKELDGHVPTWAEPGYKSDKSFMEETNIEEVLKQVGSSGVVSVIMKVAYRGDFKNPYGVLAAIEHDRVIFDELTDYFERNMPERWNMAFSELIVASDHSWMCCDCCKWRKDREEVRTNFKSFVGGQISSTLHSDRLYAFFFRLFFGYDSAASFVLVSFDASHEGDYELAQLMKGLIEKGREGVFPWDFEKYLPIK